MHVCFTLEAREGDAKALPARLSSGANFNISYLRAWRRFPDVIKRRAPGLTWEGPATASQQRLLFEQGGNASIDKKH